MILMGGLGNQLFQYARALTNSEETELIDLVSANRRTQENLPDISDFRLAPQISLLNPGNSSVRRTRILNYAIRASSNNNDLFHLKKIAKTLLSVQSLLKHKRRIKFEIAQGLDDYLESANADCLVGYFQNSLAINQVVQVGLELKNHSQTVERYEQMARIDCPLVVHFRLTDYTKEDSFGIPSTSYYLNSLKLMWANGIYKKIWVFSDDIENAKRLFPDEFLNEASFISEPTATSAEILQVMRLGHGFVIANSSYSWWAAALSRNSNARVICPTPWFSGRDNPLRIIPEGWVKLNKN
jgi:hypothetical protein